MSCKSILLDSTVIFVELSISRVTTCRGLHSFDPTTMLPVDGILHTITKFIVRDLPCRNIVNTKLVLATRAFHHDLSAVAIGADSRSKHDSQFSSVFIQFGVRFRAACISVIIERGSLLFIILKRELLIRHFNCSQLRGLSDVECARGMKPRES